MHGARSADKVDGDTPQACFSVECFSLAGAGLLLTPGKINKEKRTVELPQNVSRMMSVFEVRGILRAMCLFL